MALLIGFALDQQVTVPTAFTGPLKLKERLGTLDADAIAAMDPARLEAAFRERPAVHRFPGQHGAARAGALRDDRRGLRRPRRARLDGGGGRRRAASRIAALPGFGEMKMTALGSVLAKRFGVEAAEPLVPHHPTLGDVDSAEALERYQAGEAGVQGKAARAGVSYTDRVVAYVTRERDGRRELLVFDHRDHPDAGTQVPAGRLEAGEDLEAGLARAARGGGPRRRAHRPQARRVRRRGARSRRRLPEPRVRARGAGRESTAGSTRCSATATTPGSCSCTAGSRSRRSCGLWGETIRCSSCFS